jgi:hypothetical protein
MSTLDHLKLIQGDLREMKKMRDLLLAPAKGKLNEFTVLHEHDDSCCRREAWNVTLKRIVDTIAPGGEVLIVGDGPTS